MMLGSSCQGNFAKGTKDKGRKFKLRQGATDEPLNRVPPEGIDSY